MFNEGPAFVLCRAFVVEFGDVFVEFAKGKVFNAGPAFIEHDFSSLTFAIPSIR